MDVYRFVSEREKSVSQLINSERERERIWNDVDRGDVNRERQSGREYFGDGTVSREYRVPPQRVYTTVDRSSVREVCARARARKREEQLFRGMQTNVWFFFSLFQTSFCSYICI